MGIRYGNNSPAFYTQVNELRAKKPVCQTTELPISNTRSMVLSISLIAFALLTFGWFSYLEQILLKSIVVLLFVASTLQLIKLANQNIQVRVVSLTFVLAIYSPGKKPIPTALLPHKTFFRLAWAD